MTNSAGARIALGLGIAAVFVVLAIILEQAAGGDGAEPDVADSTTPPTELQFCIAWQKLSTASRSDRSAEPRTDLDLAASLERIREVGYPESMSLEARAGFLAAVDEIQSRVDRSFAPTAYPADPDEDAAFSTYLTEYCPA